MSHYAKGQVIFDPHHIPDSLMFLVDGTIRVSQTSDSGRDIVLYRVEAGDSCVLTTACMLAEEAYNAEGLAETRSPLLSCHARHSIALWRKRLGFATLSLPPIPAV